MIKNNMCVGKAAGQICSSELECDVGLICVAKEESNRYCESAKGVGESCDYSMNYCKVGLICGGNSKCIQMGSVKVGSQVSYSGSYHECESFWVDPVDQLVCIDPPHRTSEEYLNAGEICKFSYKDPKGETKEYQEESACGFLSTGKSVCDPDYSGLSSKRSKVLKYLANTIPCHVHRSMSPFCEKARQTMSGYTDSFQAFFDINVYNNLNSIYISVKGIDKCLYGVNRDYFYDCKGSTASAVFFYIVVGIVGGLLVLMIFGIVLALCA
jgi:hypothetical protein